MKKHIAKKNVFCNRLNLPGGKFIIFSDCQFKPHFCHIAELGGNVFELKKSISSQMYIVMCAYHYG